MRQVVDFSQWGGPLKQETVDCWRSMGITKAIVQYSYLMPDHLAILRDNAFDIEAYVYLYWWESPWGQTPLDRVRAAMDMVVQSKASVKRVWLDCEDMLRPYREDQLQECVDYLNGIGMPCGIYTGAWWWVPRTGDSHAFAHLPLLHAQFPYDRQPPDFDSFRSYGGWTRPHTWQYIDTTVVCGHEVDVSITEEDVTPLPVEVWTEDKKLRTLIDVGHFVTQGWSLKDIVGWQKECYAAMLREMQG